MKTAVAFLLAAFAPTLPLLAEDFYQLPKGGPLDYLIPAKVDPDLDYEATLREKLLSAFGRGQLGAMLAQPAFTGEYCVSLYLRDADQTESSKKDNPPRFVAVAAAASRSLYSWTFRKKTNEQPTDVIISHRSRDVSRELAVAFQRVWARAILQTRYPQVDSGPAARDGISYRFFVCLDTCGDIGGNAHNPEPGLIPYEMARIGHQFYDFVMNESGTSPVQESDLIEALQKLEKRLNHPSP